MMPDCEAEIALVAQRMRDTLVEVEGPEVGGSLYSMDWLRERVRWHLNPLEAVARVYLAIDADQQVIGHTIVRKEEDEERGTFGLFSTTGETVRILTVPCGSVVLARSVHGLRRTSPSGGKCGAILSFPNRSPVL
jgi:hypothetical protein